MSRNRVIGAQGGLPWRLPADMAHFVRTTRGKPIVTGRKNYDDIGHPLPDRRNIVLTRRSDLILPGCDVVRSPEAALAIAGDAAEVMVIGGADIYRLFLPMAGRIYLTLVHATLDGDVHFPDIDPAEWTEHHRRFRPADERNPYDLDFLLLERAS